MLLSNNQLYQCDEVRLLRKFLSEEINLLHSSILLRDFIDKIALKLDDAKAISNPIICTLVKNHMTSISFVDAEDLCSKVIDTTELAARMHGFDRYASVSSDTFLDGQLQVAIDHLLFSPLDVFRDYILSSPELLNRQTVFGHRASIVHYLGSNGIEIYRQVVPTDIVDKVEFLKSMDTNFTQSHNIYGGSCTVIDLVETSAHPHDAGIAPLLIQSLR